ncbi:MAG: hypothetical protein V9G20_03600 [Candidatus Promineifilaceae bacterium]
MTNRSTPPLFSMDSRVQLRPLSQQIENGVAIIGYGDRFLELPLEGLQFITWLNQGLSLGEARQQFEAQFNPFPEADLLDVMQAFLKNDFVAAVDGLPLNVSSAPITQTPSRIPQHWAERLWSKPVLIAWMLFVTPVSLLWLFTPDLWPQRSDYFWLDFYFLIILIGQLLWLEDMSTHEVAHWLAVRAKGIHATISWTQRLGVFPMSQTTMHNIWAVPRQARYLPLAAGMVLDIAKGSVVLYLLFLDRWGWVQLPALALAFLRYYLLKNTLALVAQFWLFSRMDGYFLLSALLGQRNLQADTFTWFKSKFNHRIKFEPPAGGMKFVYLYAVISVLGGGFVLSQFFLYSVPIRVQLIWDSWQKVTAAAPSSLDYADGVAALVSQGLYVGLLVYAHWRDRASRRK